MSRLLLCLLTLVMTSICIAVETKAGPFTIAMTTDPEVLAVGQAKVILDVKDSMGKPVTGAKISVLVKMPNMSMGERDSLASPTGKDGQYQAAASLAMAGSYDVHIVISAAAGQATSTMHLQTGRSSLVSENTSLKSPALVAILLCIGGFVLWRIKATGQSLQIKSLFDRKVLASLALLVIAYFGGTWAVKNLRREGAMTPLEAQTMEMNTPAPTGAIAVQLADAKLEPFVESVTYSGQVVGFTEQDVNTRVAGTIVSMSVYVGDKVHKGQVLARLDTSQLDPVVAEKSANVAAANESVAVSDSELEQAMALVRQAEAEVSIARADMAEAISLVNSQVAQRNSADSAVESAHADEKAALADLAAANADLTYAKQNLSRKQALYEGGAISRNELDLSIAGEKRADSMVSAAQERVTRARAMIASAESERKRVNAEISAAKDRVNKAQASVTAAIARQSVARTAVATARARIGKSRADVGSANASLDAANAQRGYADLRAEVDGVVTQRMVSPGVLVGPGQTILKIAQVAPVRIQSNVPQRDLERIKVGDLVTVTKSDGTKSVTTLKVSSVSPALDPSSRMGTVEAIYPNTDALFAPGAYVSLELEIGRRLDALVVPSSVVQNETTGTETLSYVWVASPDANGDFTVARRNIEIQGHSGGRTAVRTGIKIGEKVVIAPYGLSDGTIVRSASIEESPGRSEYSIEVTEAGYTPSQISIVAGAPTSLTFTRRIEETCATSVEFPTLGIKVDMPLNKPVTVTLPPQKSGTTLTFTCPMDMYKGTAVAK